jgi:hypothetical protein
MIANEPNGVIAVLASGQQIDAAVEGLRESGIDHRSIVVVRPGTADTELPELDRGPKHSLEVAAYWARWGAILGAGISLAIVAIPAIAAIVGLGTFDRELLLVPLVMAVGGAAVSAAIGLGIHLYHAMAYARALRRGKTVVVAHTDDRDSLLDARAVLANLGAERIDVHGLRTT